MKNITKIIRISKPLYGLVAIIATLIVVTALIDLIVPLFSKYIVDEIIASIQHKGGSISHLTVLISASFALGVFGIILTAITERLGDHFAGELRKFLTERFYHKVLTLPQSYFDSEISGKIVNQLNRGILTIQQFINTSTNFILPTFLQSILTIVILAYFNIPVAVFTFFLFPVYLALSYYSTKKWGEEEVKKNKIEDYSRGRIQEVISNIKLVKSFNTEKQEYSTISHNLTQSNKIYARQSQTFHIFDFLRNFSLNIILTAVNVIVFYSAFKGSMTLGTVVLILQLMNQARRPLFAMSFILTQVQNAEAGSKEFLEILELPSTEYFDKEYDQTKIIDPTLEFKNVSFKYETSEMVLKDISFAIAKKEKVALVGHSGVGKSTIVNLILKFYEATDGTIMLKDKNYKDLTQNYIRNNIALVFQENELFSSTIRENVAYGSRNATDEDVINALKLANAWDFVEKLPKGIESEVGERGIRLSGGQKQRIQIARAILKNSPILILDEATSSLDAKSEKEVQEGMENLMKNKLVIIIAHRFSTIQNVHQIIVLDQGKIVDSGSPQELSKRPGIYRDLLNYQVEGNKKLLAQFELY
jgi:ATP-binding cassette subfamily B protein